ncbi:VUT family protein [Mesobacillus subterraneus]|jgi:queuosine precursor transporter|uniref:VUT family protein n=1 Tax=Mesobacillus subterraneus TaxID=285983 RepID=UPI0020410925|nr:VUT family protein [Mesobacillus subterraneus]MCM3664976.1 VUT family protein [Mesobacillus subterraneus]MCM3682063.1 VUT family protein [Mesobacillus subterraneus]
MRIFLYLISIVTANVITAAFAPLTLGMFIVPMGTLLIGATFIFRDLVQNKYGRAKTYMFIGAALVLSAIVSFILGDTLLIVFASALSFAVAETTDTEIYSRLKLPMSWRVFYSGLVGGLLDSVIFVIIGLSPIGANFLPWEAVPAAILGQVIVKTIIQAIGAMLLNPINTIFNNKALSN